ncbi:ATP-dependent nuclease [Actinomadura sp. CNU-125]|uniref:ATP-dependent nuclease n=1 Tax=Actinomadura sp. CNU-125 TaxID=1904961 RepID=UPI0009F81DB7|nr:ATP-binding protein [Actinomadura sp. CNU-125]
MQIQRVRIRNYRCLRDVDISFDAITTFIGPNGVGKSAVLRALDWFFNGSEKDLTDDDVWAEAEERVISVEVEFCDLTPEDRAELGKYATGDTETVRLWRRWENDKAKLSGHMRAYPAFAEVRQGASGQLSRYRALQKEMPDLGLPSAKSAQAAEDAMAAWERANPDKLAFMDTPVDGHFFGFAGQAKMTGLFDYVFVSADLRAADEGPDVKGSILGRIMAQAIDSTGADEAMREEQAAFEKNRGTIYRNHFDKQLGDLSDELNRQVGQYITGRTLRVGSRVPPLRIPAAEFQVSVEDGSASTRIDQQGHGYQRTVLISVLQILADRKASEAGRTVFLAIEEPELFQHPIQARTFASVLRDLAESPERGVQVSYATHSPYFLETEGFDQIRRITRGIEGKAPAARVHSTTRAAVQKRLGKDAVPGQTRKQADFANKIATPTLRTCRRPCSRTP